MVCILHSTFGIEYITAVFYSPVTILSRAEVFAMLLAMEGRGSSGGFLAVRDK